MVGLAVLPGQGQPRQLQRHPRQPRSIQRALSAEDYEAKNSTVRNDFLRHWNHGPSGKTVSYEGMVEEGGDIMGVVDPRADFENKVLSEGKVEAFKSRLTEKDSEILRLRMEGHTEQEIADAVQQTLSSYLH